MGTLRLPSLALLLLLQGNAASPLSCKGEDKFYSHELQRCCYQCRSGFTPKTKCPTDHQRDCVKQCGEGQFLNYDNTTPQCEQCLSCNPERNLVEKAPCTRNSSRVCECQPGMYCQTPVRNTCARCLPLTTCKPGSGVKIRGTNDQDTVCEACPPGTFSEEDSSTETCQPHTINPELQLVTEGKENSTWGTLGVHLSLEPSVQQVIALGPSGSPGIPRGSASSNVLDTTTRQPVNESNTRGPPEKSSRAEEKDVTLLATALLFTVLLLAVLVVLWKKRACKKWIVPHKVNMSNQAKICAIGALLPAEKGPEETDLKPLESLTESSCGSPLETEETPSLDLEGAELLQTDGGVLVEPAVRSHTSNCIEKIYIMRADTVIVGSVSEVPTGKTCSARGEEGICGAQEEAEESEADMHYPEQETEFSPGSDITTPVEEEWEFPHSILANEKPLGIQGGSSGGAS
uniref:tumor necrosis factor receptor superfamily member 8 n=1 Tax=Euleptes europaea TaxID=460621 RepID=UPI0025421C1B|nr:tumor necrosis factor receptor superfamily member 8 [Euleptes europaea]